MAECRVQRMRWDEITRVLVETNDGGPCACDVWWVLESEEERVLEFPLGALGEDDVLNRLKRFDGFEVKGMNSTANARFLCWNKQTY
jgi:hypothetical protein